MLLKNLARVSLFISLTAVGAVAAKAQQTADTVPSAPYVASQKGSGAGGERDQSPVLQRRNRRYQLHPGDVLELNFSFTPEFNQTVTIQPDGYITLRGVGSIRVDGQTIPELSNSLRAAYVGILRDPVITVELRDFEKPYFLVGGQVGRPGKFDLRGETTAVGAVAIAGGLLDTAKHSKVLLFRRVPDGWVETKVVNLKRMLKNADLREDVYLQSGDFLYVPKNTFSKMQQFIPRASIGFYLNPLASLTR